MHKFSAWCLLETSFHCTTGANVATFIDFPFLLDNDDRSESHGGLSIDLTHVGFVGTRELLIETKVSNPYFPSFILLGSLG